VADPVIRPFGIERFVPADLAGIRAVNITAAE
jgi:hypothetical protein